MSSTQGLPRLSTHLSRIFALATVAISLASVVFAWTTQSRFWEAEARGRYQELSELVMTSATEAIVAEDVKVLADLVEQLGEGDRNLALVRITNDEGTVLAEWSTARSERDDLLVLPPQVVDVDGRNQGAVELRVDLSRERTAVLVFIVQSAGVVVLLLIGLLVIQLWQVNRNAVLPIRAIETRVRALEEGDLSTDFVAGGSQEFADLARSINEVAGTLEAQRRSEAEARDSLQALNEAYRRFVPQTFISLLHRTDITTVRLGDNTELPISILFCDIRSFTPMAEAMTARETFDFINAYLARLGPVVRQHDGFIDKYIGDAIMALFRSPDDAVAAGVEMFEVLQRFNEERVPSPAIRIGVGIHTGKVMLGTIGEQSRMEGTVIGDVVNLAARLEALTKATGHGMLLSEATVDALEHRERHPIQFVADFVARGRSAMTPVYRVVVAQPDVEPETVEIR